MDVGSLTRYDHYASATGGHQNPNINRIAGENVIRVLRNEYERGINRIRGIGYCKQRSGGTPCTLINRKHLENLQEARKICLTTSAPDLCHDNGAGAERAAVALSYA
jgi:hypothetical protein